jgi:uncharacterized protein (DUF1697 family)
MRYVALLRGINVGGNTMIKMGELRSLFEALGFEDVATYINSGNIGFDAGEHGREAAMITSIERGIEKTLGKKIQVMLRTASAIHKILEANPFDGQFSSHKEMHVLFMKDEMPADLQFQLLDQQTENERFAIIGREIYCHLKLGVTDSVLGKGFIEKKLKTPITARNWRTVQKLVEL